VDLYTAKPFIVRRLEPVLGWLERRNVSPDALTLAAIPIGAMAGVAILRSPDEPSWLLLVPVAVVLRLVANLLDGALARRTGRVHPRGALFNELGDRSADVLMLGAVAFVPGADAQLVWLGVVLALLASFTSVATGAAGGTRSYRGILSKPGRMALLLAFSVAVLILGPGAWAPFGPLLAIGGALTLTERVVIAVRELP
jgi:CDP-diacylglycerol--glycerol-3-phosphate 3-phosphatidyltransferase